MSDAHAVREPGGFRLSPLIRGLLLVFDRRERPSYDAGAGLRLLIIVVVLELVIGPRAHVLDFFGVAQPPAWLRIGTLMLEALVAVRLWANVRFKDVGFVSLGKWTATETIFFLEILAGAVVAFHFLRGVSIVYPADGVPWIVGGVAIGTQLLWGFYQELVYRGLLQTELTRRFGSVAGVLAANLAFTFGPLHLYHLMKMRPETMNSTFVLLGVTFAVGLLFAFIFHRTRNIWLVGMMHGVGNAITNTAAAS